MRTRYLVLIACGSGLVAVATPVGAQSREANGSTVAAPVAAQTSNGETSLDEVVVTATKRSTRLQDVPASVTVVDAAQLTNQNITSVQDITQAAPAITASG